MAHRGSAKRPPALLPYVVAGRGHNIQAQMALSLRFHGGVGTVTGSKFMLDAGGHRLLIDCGLFQGLKELRLKNWQTPPFDPRSLAAVVLTHAHIDHSGYLPRLVRAGYRGPVYCTAATRELAEILLRDAGRLQEEDAEYANRKGFSKHRPALPLFTEKDATTALRQFRPVRLDDWFEPAGIPTRLHHAGHILGSAFAEVIVPTGHAGSHSLVFSGDIGRYDAPLHSDPANRPDCGTLLLESTYGDRLHDPTPLIEQIRTPFRETIQRGGVILVPAFAVGRSQIVTLLLSQLEATGDLPSVPIHVDSPMAVDVTQTYQHYLGTAELDTLSGASKGRLFPGAVSFHRTVEESRKLNDLPGPMIIISSSGMLTGGRVLHHLRRLLPDPKNLIVLVGYQAAGTRGRALLEGAKTIRMHGEDVPVRARYISVAGLSAHADRNELMRWLRSGKTAPKSVFLTHGEPAAAEALAAGVNGDGIRTWLPQVGQEFTFDPADDHWTPGRATSV
jgi:metallo-beta-lactamase family protein